MTPPILCAPTAAATHSHMLGAQMPIRSPLTKPSASNARATRSASASSSAKLMVPSAPLASAGLSPNRRAASLSRAGIVVIVKASVRLRQPSLFDCDHERGPAHDNLEERFRPL